MTEEKNSYKGFADLMQDTVNRGRIKSDEKGLRYIEGVNSKVYIDKEKKIEPSENLNYKCVSCGAEYSSEIKKCRGCEGKVIKKESEYSNEEISNSIKYFREKNLLDLIHKELSKTHIGDDNLKLTLFLTALSSLLKNPKRRMSQVTTGNSGEGKDNVIKTILKHLPREIFIFLTSGTQATIEDDIKGKRIIAFSEVNAVRENGANKYLIEVIKQVTEGGTSAMKKDIRTGMKSSRHEECEQMSVLFGTTEEGMDKEMASRFIKSTIETDPKRIKIVNNNTFDIFSDIDKLLNDSKEIDSWIRIGLTEFFKKKNQPEVYLPYAKFLKDKVRGKDIFDHSDARSQRDIKRVLALTCAITYLFQEQREILEYKGQKVLVSQAQDLINTLVISSEFFNQSYGGLDKRLTNVLKIMETAETEWVERNFIQDKMDIKRKVTIKQYCNTLSEEGLIEGCSGRELNEIEDVKIYNSNKIYYKRVQKGVKKPLIRVQINDLKEHLEEKTKKSIDPFEIRSLSSIKEEIENKKGVKKQGVISEKKENNLSNSEDINKNDPFSLTPFEKEDKKPLKLLDFIKQKDSQSVNFQELKENFPEKDLKANLKQLQEQGIIYSPKENYWRYLG